MGLWDSLSGVGDWIGRNSSWLQPVAQFGVGLYERNQQNKGRQNFFDALKAGEDRNYQDQLAYQDYLNQQGEAASGAAAAAEEAKLAALAEARAALEKAYKEAKKYYKPYYDAGTQVLPGVVKNYQGGQNMVGLLQSYLTQANQLAKLDQGKPSWAVNVPLPDYLK